MPQFRKVKSTSKEERNKPDWKPQFELVEYPTAQFRIYKPRYVLQAGEDYPGLVMAHADDPKVIELPEFEADGTTPFKIDDDLEPVEAPVRPPQKQHFAKPMYGPQIQTAADLHGKSKSHRASDKSAV